MTHQGTATVQARSRLAGIPGTNPHASRSINPVVVEQFLSSFGQSKELLEEDVVGLTVLALGRAVQKDLFAGIKNPSGSDYRAAGKLACQAVVDFTRPWGEVRPYGRTPALGVFDARSNAILRAMVAFDSWSEKCEGAWRTSTDGEPVSGRWKTVLRVRGMVLDTVYPRKLEQFPHAVKRALSGLSELSDPEDMETTAVEVHSGLFEVHHSLVMEKGEPGLFVGRDGQLRLGWTQSRDALAHERGISRRRLEAERDERSRTARIVHRACTEDRRGTAEIVSDINDVADTLDVMDAVRESEIMDRVRNYADLRLDEVDRGSNRWHVLSHLVALLTREMKVSDLARLVDRDHAGLWRAYDEERKRVTAIMTKG